MITVITILNYTMISGLVKRGRSQNFGLTGAEKLRKINKNRKAADWNGSKREYGRSKYARGADPRRFGRTERIWYPAFFHAPRGEGVRYVVRVTVRKDQIVDISRVGVYTMTDGRTFQGRQRHLAEHKLLRQELMPLSSERGDEAPKSLLKKCTLMCASARLLRDRADVRRGRATASTLSSATATPMAVVEGVPVENMVNRSFYEVFPDGDRKWLVSCADTALNGSCHTLRDYSRELEQNLTIHCYQPESGYCACLLLPED